ncbi:MAG: hypothetical protein OEW19_00835 [Acidobacteriota bacterium]|nr:hypothetical protein [Acidobacteriota bacterium]
MRRRPVRILVLLLTVVVTAVAVWRATLTEQSRGRARLSDQRVDAEAADAIYALADLRASLHAYVAPGQGLTFWSARAAEQLQRLRTLTGGIEEATASARYPLADARDALDRLAEAEARARGHAEQGRLLLAGDVVFVETGRLIDAVASEISGARQALARAASAREAGTANAQSLLAGGVLATWIVALLLLVPLPGDDAHPSSSGVARTTETVSLEGPVGLGPEELPAEARPRDTGTAEVASQPNLGSLAALCGDLGTVVHASELDPLLARAAALMGARGLMIWLPEQGGGRLVPAAASGYDSGLIGRLGSIARDADNLTASAFRSGAPALAPGTTDRPAAIAVPLRTADGAGGVLAAELRTGVDHDLSQVAALAEVVAAQLANLFPAPPKELPRATPAQV